jgi:FtsH-binding integral membrane protein
MTEKPATRGDMMAYPQPTTTPVIHADEDTRAQFLVKVYQHVVLAVAAFVAIETVLFTSGLARVITDLILGSGGFGWLAILGGFTLVSAIAGRSAQQIGNTSAQYAALFAMAAAQSLLFTPFLYIVFNTDGAGTVASAAVVTIVGFAALTAVAMTTRRELSFLRPLIMWGSIVAIGLIIGSVILGFQLGLIFSVAMVGLAGASILYETQNIVRRYPEWAYVAAAVSLFSSLMLLFWYVLRIFASRD